MGQCLCNGGTNMLKNHDYLSETEQALSELFAQERKEELPFRYGDYWVHPIGDEPITGIRRVIVVGHNTYTTLIEGGADSTSAHAAAARAYFAAHPKPRPWLDAGNYEVWWVSDHEDGDEYMTISHLRDTDVKGVRSEPVFYGPEYPGGLPASQVVVGYREES